MLKLVTWAGQVILQKKKNSFDLFQWKLYIEILVEKGSYEIVHTKSEGNLGAESNLRNEQLEEGRRRGRPGA